MTSPLCTHLIPEDQCLHCLTPALRVAIDALAQARAENTMLRGDNHRLREALEELRYACTDKAMAMADAALDYDPCASKDHGEAALAAGGE